jgi:uracil-DNA glycosylase family 4
MSSDNYEDSMLQDIIDEALSSSPSKSYGQLGFMETDIVSSIFEAIDKKLPNADVVNIIKEARVSVSSSKVSMKITDLHTVSHNCRKCSFNNIVPALPKWNVTNPDVLFILETSYMDQNASDLLISSLKNSGFSSENICLTYLVRCPTRDLDQKYIQNCISYLQSEIHIMNPKLICTIGANVLSFIFGQDLKIKDYKQKITWLGSWPIYPLYSLNYVLKSGESAKESFQQDISQIYQICYKKENKNDTQTIE